MNAPHSAPNEHLSPAKENRMPQLDGLRAFAVLGVIWFHWAPEYVFGLPLASGVSLFFVLSGFLITGILFDARMRHTNHWWSLRQFYARRVLRIWPIFYLTLAVCIVLNYNNCREVWMWHAAYLTNFLTAIMQYRSGPMQHFWSLSVEEQFYIFWPLIMLFIPKRSMLRFIVFTILLSPLFRLLIVFKYPDLGYWHMLPVCCLDMLGMGALLAYMAHFEPRQEKTERLVKTLGWIGIPTSVLIGLYRVAKHGQELPPLLDALRSFAISMCFAWLVYRAARGFSGWFGRLLEMKWFMGIGKISYGLYVYHMFTPDISEWLAGVFHIPDRYTHPFIGRILLYTTVTFGLSLISWFVVEKPINSLKRFFPYNSKKSSGADYSKRAESGLKTMDAAR